MPESSILGAPKDGDTALLRCAATLIQCRIHRADGTTDPGGNPQRGWHQHFRAGDAGSEIVFSPGEVNQTNLRARLVFES